MCEIDRLLGIDNSAPALLCETAEDEALIIGLRMFTDTSTRERQQIIRRNFKTNKSNIQYFEM